MYAKFCGIILKSFGGGQRTLQIILRSFGYFGGSFNPESHPDIGRHHDVELVSERTDMTLHCEYSPFPSNIGPESRSSFSS